MVLMDNLSATPLLDMRGIDFLSVLDRLDDGVMITDLDGTILFYNQTQVKIDGIPAKEAPGQKGHPDLRTEPADLHGHAVHHPQSLCQKIKLFFTAPSPARW